MLSLVERPISDFVGFPSVDKRLCPITRMEMVDPYECENGHLYERAALLAWLDKYGTFPYSVLPIRQ